MTDQQAFRIPPDRWSPLLLVLWVTLNFGWTIPFGFINDDSVWVYGASTASKGVGTLAVPAIFSRGFLRPLVQASFVLNYAVGGVRPESYRVLNIAAHAAVVLLLWRVLRRLVGTGWCPLVAAAAFAVHPNRAEAVVWVSGRTEDLCALFYVGAVAAHQGGRRVLGVTCFVLALAAKETAVSLPLLLVGLVWLQPPVAAMPEGLVTPGRGREVIRLWPYGVVLTLYLTARALLLTEFAPLTLDVTMPQAAVFLRQKVTLLGQYLLSPLPVYGFGRSLLLLALGPVVALWCTRSSPVSGRLGVRVGVLWAGVTLLPYVAWPFFLPWYTYLPSMGVSLAVTALGADLLRRVPGRKAALVGAGLATIWLGASVALLQAGNERLHRAGRRTELVAAAVARAVRAAPPTTVFIVSGLERDVLGAGPGLGGMPVFLSGLTEAVRMQAGGAAVDVELGDRSRAERRASRRPVVLLEWDEQSQEFRRAWQSF
jgi:hypothetical protein